jgi:hypothetical protein
MDDRFAGWPERIGPDPPSGWIRLRRAVLLFRLCSGKDWRPGWEDGTPDAQFEHQLRQAGALEAKINRDSAQIELTLPRGRGAGSEMPFHFYLDEFNPSEIRDPQLRAALSAAVALIQAKMMEEFMLAVLGGRCMVFARPNSVLTGYTRIGPEVFGRFTVTNWALGDAEAASGDRLYSIHVAPVQLQERETQRRPRSKSQMIKSYLGENYPAGVPSGKSVKVLHHEIQTFLDRKGDGETVSQSLVQKVVKHYSDP